MRSVDEIIEALGGSAAIAFYWNIKPGTVRCWKYRKSIPYKYWKRIIDIAHREQIKGITLDGLWDLHA